MKLLTKPCPGCGGLGYNTGITSPPESVPYNTPCDKCDSTGILVLGYLDDDLIVRINDIFDKCNDIFEKVSE